MVSITKLKVNNVCVFKFSIYPLNTTQNSCSIVSKKVLYISFDIILLSVPIAEWLECHPGERGVAGSNTGGDIHHFELFAYFPLITARRIPYKCNQA